MGRIPFLDRGALAGGVTSLQSMLDLGNRQFPRNDSIDNTGCDDIKR